MEQSGWTQSELAARVGVSAATIRKLLHRLRDAGLPLVRSEEHPQVHWDIRSGWIPGGIALDGDDVRNMLRLLARLRRTQTRDRLIARLLKLSPNVTTPVANVELQVGEHVLPIIEDAAAKRVTLAFDYLSGARGVRGWRTASVARVEYGDTTRMIALCHRSGELRHFRIDRVLAAKLETGEPFRTIAEVDVAKFIGASIDGYAGKGEAVRCAFVVRGEAARWVQSNLPKGTFVVEMIEGGIRVSAVTAGVEVLARFVVGLGDAALPESVALQDTVKRLAEGALAQAEHAGSQR